jgi:hypothetical protein
VSEDDALSDHEVAMIPVQHQFLFLASLQGLVQVSEAMIKGLTINREVIHEDLQDIFDHV